MKTSHLMYFMESGSMISYEDLIESKNKKKVWKVIAESLEDGELICITDVAKKTDLSRLTASKYIYELKGKGAINLVTKGRTKLIVKGENYEIWKKSLGTRLL